MLSIDSARATPLAYGPITAPTRPTDTGGASRVTVPFSLTTDPSLDPSAIGAPAAPATPKVKGHHHGHHHQASPPLAPTADPTDESDPLQSENNDLLQTLLQQTHTKMRTNAVTLA